MRKLILNIISLVSVTLVSYSANINIETKTLINSEPDNCELLREMIYDMMLTITDDDTACGYATLVQNACYNQQKQ